MKYAIVAIALLFPACGKVADTVTKTEYVAGPQGERGAQGEQGIPGTPGVDAEIETIELCPSIAGDGFHEYLLRIGGNLFAVYASGTRIFMTKLKVNQGYVTTDGRACGFTVNAQGEVI